MPEGWAKNPARDSTSISHAEIRRLHLPSGRSLRTQRRTAGDHTRRLAGNSSKRPAFDSGTGFLASPARLEMDLGGRGIRPADAPRRLPGDEPEALSGADLGVRT